MFARRDTDLHHEQQRIEHDQHHDKVLEWRRDYNLPDFVFETVPLAWHVTFIGSGAYCKIDARFLQRRRNIFEYLRSGVRIGG